MGFNNKIVVGDGTSQEIIVGDGLTDGIVNSIIVYNSTDAIQYFSVLIDDVTIIRQRVDAGETYKFFDKINVAATSVLNIIVPTGVSATLSYIQQAIDEASALSVVQEYAAAAAEDADRAENAIPSGTIDDTAIATDSVWSSLKVNSEIEELSTYEVGDTINTLRTQEEVGSDWVKVEKGVKDLSAYPLLEAKTSIHTCSDSTRVIDIPTENIYMEYSSYIGVSPIIETDNYVVSIGYTRANRNPLFFYNSSIDALFQKTTEVNSHILIGTEYDTTVKSSNGKYTYVLKNTFSKLSCITSVGDIVYAIYLAAGYGSYSSESTLITVDLATKEYTITALPYGVSTVAELDGIYYLASPSEGTVISTQDFVSYTNIGTFSDSIKYITNEALRPIVVGTDIYYAYVGGSTQTIRFVKVDTVATTITDVDSTYSAEPYYNIYHNNIVTDGTSIVVLSRYGDIVYANLSLDTFTNIDKGDFSNGNASYVLYDGSNFIVIDSSGGSYSSDLSTFTTFTDDNMPLPLYSSCILLSSGMYSTYSYYTYLKVDIYNDCDVIGTYPPLYVGSDATYTGIGSDADGNDILYLNNGVSYVSSDGFNTYTYGKLNPYHYDISTTDVAVNSRSAPIIIMQQDDDIITYYRNSSGLRTILYSTDGGSNYYINSNFPTGVYEPTIRVDNNDCYVFIPTSTKELRIFYIAMSNISGEPTELSISPVSVNSPYNLARNWHNLAFRTMPDGERVIAFGSAHGLAVYRSKNGSLTDFEIMSDPAKSISQNSNYNIIGIYVSDDYSVSWFEEYSGSSYIKRYNILDKCVYNVFHVNTEFSTSGCTIDFYGNCITIGDLYTMNTFNLSTCKTDYDVTTSVIGYTYNIDNRSWGYYKYTAQTDINSDKLYCVNNNSSYVHVLQNLNDATNNVLLDLSVSGNVYDDAMVTTSPSINTYIKGV